MTKSPRLSFKGYNISEALYRNLDSIKGVLALVTGVNFFAGFDYKTFLLTVGAASVALLFKLVEDAVHFYFAEVDL
jgi:hypothetical protein